MLKQLKQDVGQRFKTFRIDRKKAQHLLAAELKVHQSTITNIEHGTTFPKINYLQYFYEKYGLNINWLVTGEGEMYMRTHPSAVGASTISYPNVQYGDPKFEQYNELMNLMQIPVVEQVVLAKLMECKTLFKDEVKDFLNQQERENREKKKRAERAKVQK
ncbi:MAG: helix-turn-helix domain-containing protein [Candidatus Omnitrophota bacterium]